MNSPLDALYVFAILTFFHLWGGAAIGAGLRARRPLPVCWGVLIGTVPIYFGVERGVKLGAWAAMGWQVSCLLVASVTVGVWLPLLRAWFLRSGATSLMIGTFIMATGAILGAYCLRRGSEGLSVVLGGAGFMLGAMWFGSGLQRLRGRDTPDV
jgi:hypothetical protein